MSTFEKKNLKMAPSTGHRGSGISPRRAFCGKSTTARRCGFPGPPPSCTLAFRVQVWQDIFFGTSRIGRLGTRGCRPKEHILLGSYKAPWKPRPFHVRPLSPPPRLTSLTVQAHPRRADERGRALGGVRARRAGVTLEACVIAGSSWCMMSDNVCPPQEESCCSFLEAPGSSGERCPAESREGTRRAALSLGVVNRRQQAERAA